MSWESTVTYYQLINEAAVTLALIDRYPDDETAFIGLLMVAKDLQGHGVGAFIVKALSEA